jgi:hypothetical protein
MPSITLTRQELYDRVWATPIDTLAKQFGLSGRGLGKLCARCRIPVPPRGYWAKKAAGQRVFKPTLPPDDDPYRQEIHLDDRISSEAEATDALPEVHPLVAFERMPEHRLSVDDSLQITHEYALKTQRLLKRAKRDPNGLSIVPAGVLHMRASRGVHERALRILQALLTAFDARSFPVTTTTEGVRVTILDEPLGFGIEEELTSVEHRITFTEQKLIDRGLGWQVPKVDHVPSGKLTLVITNVRGMRYRWTEGSVRPEDRLNTFIVGLVRAALGVKRQRAEAEEQERVRKEDEHKRQEEARRVAEAERRWREEQGRVERLERLLEVWGRHNRLRELVATLRRAVGDVEAESEIGRWLHWASAHVDHTDPVRWCRQRTGRTLTLYYYGYDRDYVQRDGFKEPEPVGYTQEKVKAGVELTARPPRLASYEQGLKVELPEDLLLPYEWAQASDWYYRLFRIPAALLNRTLSFGELEQQR